MFHDVKAAPVSPSKGKVREESHWNAGWWEFHPLLEQAQRPVQWSGSSTIFTSHPTQPLLTARHFSSSKQFVIPSPAPIVSSPGSFESPTVISVASQDDWLFAYFPGRDSNGTGCLWKRGPQVDSWDVQEWWSIPRGAGIVAASWLGTTREWSSNHTGLLTRLPPRGPRTPVSSPTLLLVTQAHQLHVYYFRNYIPSLKVISSSLLQPEITGENRPHAVHDVTNGLDGVRLCVNAAIGLGYSESSILIATRSFRYPSPTTRLPQYSAIDLNLPLEISHQSSSEVSPSIEWESWGEESTIDLCEIQLRFDGLAMSLFAIPLQPIYHPRSGLTNLIFISTPPQPAANSTRSSPLSRKKESERGKMYLAASYLDFGDYTSTPKSELVLHSISRNISTPSTTKPAWISHHEATRSFSPEVLVFLASRAVPTAPDGVGIYAGILETSGTLSSQKKFKQVPIGEVKVLKLPGLDDSETWESSSIMSSVGRVGRELPLNAVVSPNNTLICTVSSSLWTTQTSIQKLPSRSWKKAGSSGIQLVPPLSSALASAILSGKATSDVTHTLSLPSTPINDVVDTLYHAFAILERYQNGVPGKLIWETLGLTAEVYRMRARQAGRNSERETLTARWQTAHDMCSIAACNMAFEDCKDGDMYDLEAVWQLIGLSSWLVSFVERLLKECILSYDFRKSEPSKEPGDDLFGSNPPSPAFELPPQMLDSPILLHLVQPFALKSLHTSLNHVKLLRNHLGMLSARAENAQIARDVLIDLVDCSGIDMNALEPLFADFVRDVKTLTLDDTRSLALCQPTLAMNSRLRKVVQTLINTPVIDKSRLFIKPFDLVDGVSRLSLEGHGKEKDKDVISKGMLTNRGTYLTCLRCNGKSEMGGDVSVAGHVSLRWRAWEKMWTSRCICGGSWARGTRH